MSQPTGGMFVCRGRPCPLLHFWISRTQHWLRQLSWFWHQIYLHICRGMALEHSSAEWGTSLYPSYWPPSDTFTAESRSQGTGIASAIIHCGDRLSLGLLLPQSIMHVYIQMRRTFPAFFCILYMLQPLTIHSLGQRKAGRYSVPDSKALR